MPCEFDKNLRVLNEILTYCYTLGARKYSISLEIKDETTNIYIEASRASFDNDKYALMRHALSLRRSTEYEHYSALCGGGGQLELVGMMLDYAEVEHTENTIRIMTTRCSKKNVTESI